MTQAAGLTNSSRLAMVAVMWSGTGQIKLRPEPDFLKRDKSPPAQTESYSALVGVGAKVMRIDFEVGVLLWSATLATGTSTFASG